MEVVCLLEAGNFSENKMCSQTMHNIFPLFLKNNLKLCVLFNISISFNKNFESFIFPKLKKSPPPPPLHFFRFKE